MAKVAEIKASLIEQLKAKGADVMLYRDLIDQYLWFLRQFRQMKIDISKRGRTYTAISAQGKNYEKNNPCVKDALLYSKQMVSILSALGLNTDKVIPPEEQKGDEERDL